MQIRACVGNALDTSFVLLVLVLYVLYEVREHKIHNNVPCDMELA